MKLRRAKKPTAAADESGTGEIADSVKKPAPTFPIRVPIARAALHEDQTEVAIADEIEHAFFLRCCELYRQIHLLERKLPELIDTYSRYRTRDHFKEALTFRYFEGDESIEARFDPSLAATMFAMFNLLHELRLSIAFADALPFSIKGEIETALSILVKEWAILRDGVFEKYGWNFKYLQIGV